MRYLAPVIQVSSAPPTLLAYGAAGNGAKDDTAALLEAVDATPAGGGIIIPAGYTFKLTGEVSIDKPLAFYGGGTLDLTATTGNGFVVNAAATFADLTFLGGKRAVVLTDGSDATTDASHALGLGAGNIQADIGQLVVRGCTFDGVERPIVAFMDGDTWAVKRVAVHHNTFLGGLCGVSLAIRRLQHAHVTDNAFIGLDSTGAGMTPGGNPVKRAAGHAILLGVDAEEAEGGDWLIARNVIDGVTDTRSTGSSQDSDPEVQGIRAWGGARVVIDSNTIRNVTADAGGNCDGIYTKCHALRVTNNVLEDAGIADGAIVIKGAPNSGGRALGSNVLVAYNEVSYTAGREGYGCLVEAVENVIVTGNTFTGGGGPAAKGCITVAPMNIDGLTVTGNRIVDFAGEAGILSRAWGRNHRIANNDVVNLTGALSEATDLYAVRVNLSVAEGDIDNLWLADNLADTLTTPDGGTSNAFAVHATTASVNNLIADGNVLRGSATRGLRLSRSDTFGFTSARVIDNDTAAATSPASVTSGAAPSAVVSGNVGFDSL